jgi:hypothetical protein
MREGYLEAGVEVENDARDRIFELVFHSVERPPNAHLQKERGRERERERAKKRGFFSDDQLCHIQFTVERPPNAHLPPPSPNSNSGYEFGYGYSVAIT